MAISGGRSPSSVTTASCHAINCEAEAAGGSDVKQDPGAKAPGFLLAREPSLRRLVAIVTRRGKPGRGLGLRKGRACSTFRLWKSKRGCSMLSARPQKEGPPTHSKGKA